MSVPVWVEGARPSRRTDHLDRCGESNPPDLFRALAEELARIDSVIEELALLGSKTANDSVKLGALKARLIAANQRSTILRACGLLPRDDRIWRQQTDLRQVARVLLTSVRDLRNASGRQG